MIASPVVPVRLSLAQCHAAWCKARRGKKASVNQLRFSSRWLPRLQQLHADLRAGTWVPRRTVSFVVSRPKTREIHAPDFSDRVLHHWLVPQLESLYEPIFIHDSYANRRGKGSHAAVDRLQAFMRQRQGRGCFLQLDIHNFFNSIHRPSLYAMLKARFVRDVRNPKRQLSPERAMQLKSLCHKLLHQPVVELCCNPKIAAQVPPHKRLCNARPYCGLPIGNLTSQFFANVVLNELDQFVKHTLKVKHYVRYVDDFVLLADSDEPLQQWHSQIEEFLRKRLRLTLKTEFKLAPLKAGVDFLGYVVFPYHRWVRSRVVQHCKQKLAQWEGRHCKDGKLKASAEQLAALHHMLRSYWGHFAHAKSVRLRLAIVARFSWLRALFDVNPRGDLAPRWVLQGTTFSDQVTWIRNQWLHAWCEVQKGYETLRYAPLRTPDGSRVRATQTGWLRHGTRRREITLYELKECI